MKSLLVLGVFCLVTSVYANEQPKHIISIGSDGFGWSGVGETFNWNKNKSNTENVEESESSLELNYMYVLKSRTMIGFELSSGSESIVVTDAAGTVIRAEEKSTSIGLSLGYNFDDNFTETWWLKGTLAQVSQENKLKSTLAPTEKNDFTGTAVKLSLGKRFSLANINLKNVSYSPSIEVSYLSYGKKAEDLGIDSANNVSLNILKFDLMF